MDNSTKLYTIPRGGAICKFVFALMCCVMMAMQSYGQEVEAYAVYKYGTLTFYCDDQRASRESSDETFDLPSLSNPPQSPEWLAYDPYISRVVFDKSFKKARPQTCYRWFNLSFLDDIKDIKYLNTSEVENMAWMFSHSQRLLEIDLSHFDTRKVTDMSYMFHECTGFTELNLSSFNTEEVKNMSNMFYGMNNIQFTELDLSSFIVQWNLQHMEEMFADCKYLRTIKVSSGWEPRFVTDAESYDMFSGCDALIGEQNTSVADVSDDKYIEYARIDGGTSRPGFFTTGNEPYAVMSNDHTKLTFYYDKDKSKRDLTTYYIGWNYWQTNADNVTLIEIDESFKNYHPVICDSWFGGLQKLEKIDRIEYLNTDKVINMNFMFGSCSKLESIDLSHFNTENVTNMSRMFLGCNTLTELDLSTFNTQDVDDISQMFLYCPNLKTIYVDANNWKLEEGLSSERMFDFCINLRGGQCTPYNKSITNAEYARIDGVDGKPGYLTIKGGAPCSKLPYGIVKDGTLTLYYTDTKPTEEVVYNPPFFYSDGHYDDGGWRDIPDPVYKVVFDKSFNEYYPTSCQSWFANKPQLTEFENTQFFHTNQVTNMQYMFGDCPSIANLDLSFLNTDNVTTMQAMFNGCINLEELNISSFNPQNVTTMETMFGICQKLTTIYVDGQKWILNKELKSPGMFAGCNQLHGGQCTPYDGNKLDAEYARVDGGDDAPGYFTQDGNEPCIKKEPFGVLVDSTLTLYYSGIKPSNGKVFEIIDNGSEGIYDGEVGWRMNDAASVNKVVFDQSFKSFYPTSCHNWFASMENLTSIVDIQYLNTDSVHNMQFMFGGCSKLKNIDLSHFKTDSVNYNDGMSGMFMFCPFEVLDISSFNTKNVTVMSGMFAHCPNLKTIFVGDGWSTESVILGDGMFLNCSPNLRGGQCTPYDKDHIDVDYARIDGFEGKPGYFTKKGDPVCTLINKIANSQILTQNFTIPAEISTLDADISQLDDFCKGTQSPITLQIKTGAVVDKYEISIDGGNTSQGETPKPTISTDTIYNINVDIKNIKSGIHTGSIKLWEGENWFEDTFALQVTAAQNVIMHLYTDVIFVNNGDRLFLDQWQWYKNEKTITNANYQYLYDTEMSGNTYMCKIKTKDGVDVYTCPFTEPISKNLSASVTIAPNPASEVEPVNISIANFDPETDYTISIYNSNGMVVRTIYHANQNNAISLKSGIYSGALIYNSTKKGFKLIVR